jgi:hypothetical protein
LFFRIVLVDIDECCLERIQHRGSTRDKVILANNVQYLTRSCLVNIIRRRLGEHLERPDKQGEGRLDLSLPTPKLSEEYVARGRSSAVADKKEIAVRFKPRLYEETHLFDGTHCQRMHLPVKALVNDLACQPGDDTLLDLARAVIPDGFRSHADIVVVASGLVAGGVKDFGASWDSALGKDIRRVRLRLKDGIAPGD